jgi:hypothetical protein
MTVNSVCTPQNGLCSVLYGGGMLSSGVDTFYKVLPQLQPPQVQPQLERRLNVGLGGSAAVGTSATR